MRNLEKLWLVIGISMPFFVNGQTPTKEQDSLASVEKLKDVVVVARKFSKTEEIGQKKITLSSAQIVTNPTNFTSVLRYASPVAIVDYGNGGTSSVRFRGTSATNTVVLWNGISINAIGNGQTDLNAIAVGTIDAIAIQSGGNSVLYGSGAIGGALLLEDKLTFSEHFDNQLFLSYGSFNTTSNFFKSNYGNEKFTLKIAASLNDSDNDYTYIDDRYTDENGNLFKNENGNYLNNSIAVSGGYKISEKNTLFFYTTAYQGDRLFSAGLPNPKSGTERYKNDNQRNLIKWETKFNNFIQTINGVIDIQDYSYYANKFHQESSYGKSQKYLIDYQLKHRISNRWAADYMLVYEEVSGETNQINPKNRKALSAAGHVSYRLESGFISNIGFRKEFNSDFSVPFVVNLGAEQTLVKDLKIKANLSTNYRVPSFNENYWPVSGNRNLRPEYSQQAELGLAFEKYGFQFSGTYFYIDIQDKILWLPKRSSNIWAPENIEKTNNRGAELYIDYKRKIGHHRFAINSNYVNLSSKDLNTQKQLPYNPKHLVNYRFDYGYKIATIYLQGLYQSRVYTNKLNLKFYSLDPVNVLNIGSEVQLFQKEKEKIVLGFKVNNIQNSVYYFTNLRPMPGRNYTISINYKF